MTDPLKLKEETSQSIIKCRIVELVSGEFSEKIHLIWRKNIVEYLTATDFRRHVWCSWLAGRDRWEDKAQVLGFLSKSKSKDIIADAYGSCPFGYLSAMKRLGTLARRPRTYQSLFRVLSLGGYGAKLVHHAGEIDDDMIYNLAAVPNDEFSSIVVSSLSRKSVDPEKLYGAVWVASRISSMHGREQVVEAVTNSSNPMKALRELVLRLPFPSSPMECRSPLIPVKSVGEVRTLSRKFRNCLSDADTLSELVFAIQSGQQYLYHWKDGESSALILIRKFASLGWAIEEAFGIGNKRLDETTMRRIERELGKTGSLCLAWPLQMTMPTRGWFFE